jgi:hypothetical protein
MTRFTAGHNSSARTIVDAVSRTIRDDVHEGADRG